MWRRGQIRAATFVIFFVIFFLLKLTQNQVAEIFSHARQAFPQECCGLLGGSRGDGLASSVYRLTNAAENPLVEYEAAPAELFKAQREMRLRGEKLLGIYHSHPLEDVPAPSETDVRRAFYPEAIYFIVGCANNKTDEYILRGFRLDENERRWEKMDFVVIR